MNDGILHLGKGSSSHRGVHIAQFHLSILNSFSACIIGMCNIENDTICAHHALCYHISLFFSECPRDDKAPLQCNKWSEQLLQIYCNFS